MSETIAAKIMLQVLSAIHHCHMNKITHRDIKPDNILVDLNSQSEGNKGEMTVKVIDFGISCKFDPKKKLTLGVGTPYYVAPEVLVKDYDEKVDVWSAGVILYILLSGQAPFDGRNNTEIYTKITKAAFSFSSQEWSSVSKSAKDLIKKMLTKHASSRISAEKAMQDPWVKHFNQKHSIEKPICMNALTNLKNFHCERQLEQAVMAYIANQMMTK